MYKNDISCYFLLITLIIMSDNKLSDSQKNLSSSIFLNIFIVVFEIIFGLLSRSLALISDALHNVTDVASMVLSLWGEKVAIRPATSRKTYGYKKMEAIIAFTNGGILLAVVIFIVIEAIKRLFNPTEVAGFQMIMVASVALLGNGIATYLLEKNAHQNLNLKSAWLHSFQDAVFSLVVIIGAIIIYFTKINWIDPVLSIIISIFLLKEIYSLISEAVDMLLDSVPCDIDFEDIKEVIASINGVVKVEDLHIWQTGTNARFLSAHLVASGNSSGKLLSMIQVALKEKYKICHTTIQIISEAESGMIRCEHCN